MAVIILGENTKRSHMYAGSIVFALFEYTK